MPDVGTIHHRRPSQGGEVYNSGGVPSRPRATQPVFLSTLASPRPAWGQTLLVPWPCRQRPCTGPGRSGWALGAVCGGTFKEVESQGCGGYFSLTLRGGTEVHPHPHPASDALLRFLSSPIAPSFLSSLSWGREWRRFGLRNTVPEAPGELFFMVAPTWSARWPGMGPPWVPAPTGLPLWESRTAT